MANHNNYANDRDLMMEAYASVRGEVPATSTTAMPRMLNEAHCDEEHKGKVKFTLQGVGGYHGQTLAGDGETFDSLEEVCAAAGVDVEECKKAELWDDMGDGTKEFGVDEDTVIIMHAEDAEGKYPAEDGGCAAHSDEEHSELFAKIDQDVSNGVGRAELEGNYGKEAVAAYIKWGEETNRFEGEMEDEEHSEDDKEPIALVEKHMALVKEHLNAAGMVAGDAASPAVNKVAGKLGADIQEELHHFMDNFGE